MTPVDVMSYMLPNQVWALSNHLETSTKLPLSTVVQGNQVWLLKGLQGYPWDMNTFDANYVYQSITEVSYTDSSSFKMFASKSWPNGNGGIVWSPRWVNPGFNPPIVTPDTTYRTYTACKVTANQVLGGVIETQVSGPYIIDFGGDLGTQYALVLTYKWGPGFVNMEVNYYAQNYGWVQWQLWNLANGIYSLKQTSAFNMIVTGGSPVVDFPCGVPVAFPVTGGGAPAV